MSRAPEDARARLKEMALFAPRLLVLVARLLRDPRVAPRQKAILVFLAAYLASPIDLIPDFIPGLGAVDDLILAAYALDQILNRVPEEAVREHWDGDEDILQIVKEILAISRAAVPGWLRKRLSG
ncbi:MAG TPA: YkvA family protein [Actinomycetota bacterium]|jgi:uncharacterized membrane protein YkvA (DUF1232 family)|nr:YkvA family protein [Actinomycetota bacterium]